MHLKPVDPRTLKVNPNNPRRMSAGEHPDAQMVANIQAVGILQPPVVREDGDDLEIVAGHRRVAAAIAAGWTEILVLVRGPDDGGDALRAMSENVVRAQMGPVDQWRAIEALVSAEWTEQAIATALALPVRTLRKLRLLAQLLPAMLDQMALGDMPEEGILRTIAAASADEQAAVWKKHKPKKGQRAVWWEIARALAKRTLPTSAAKFGAELAQAYGIGRSIHAGQVVVADGTDLARQKIERVLVNDPGTGVMRHVDAGYERAAEVARERGLRVPLWEY